MDILAFFQRLISPIGQAEVKAAWLEFTLLIGCIGTLIVAFKTKDFSTIFQQGPTFYTTLLILVTDIRSIVMSNQTAIANKALPKVTGTVNATLPNA
ncbi:MAG TPA: hypothetical protein VGM92_06965 [Candidatus Kapabacteria bacterium]|jgi:hypothetical protein